MTVWQGSADLIVPIGHGEWLAKHLPNAERRLLPGIGHISLTARYYDAVLDALVAPDH